MRSVLFFSKLSAYTRFYVLETSEKGHSSKRNFERSFCKFLGRKLHQPFFKSRKRIWTLNRYVRLFALIVQLPFSSGLWVLSGVPYFFSPFTVFAADIHRKSSEMLSIFRKQSRDSWFFCKPVHSFWARTKKYISVPKDCFDSSCSGKGKTDFLNDTVFLLKRALSIFQCLSYFTHVGHLRKEDLWFSSCHDYRSAVAASRHFIQNYESIDETAANLFCLLQWFFVWCYSLANICHTGTASVHVLL